MAKEISDEERNDLSERLQQYRDLGMDDKLLAVYARAQGPKKDGGPAR